MSNDTVPVVQSSITIDIPIAPATLPSPAVGFLEEELMASGGSIGEEGPLMPGSAFNFLIGGLFAFIAIKAQGNTGFPFQTNHRTTMVSVGSLIMFALAEHLLSVRRPPRTSVSAIVSHFGRMVSLNQLGCQGFRN